MCISDCACTVNGEKGLMFTWIAYNVRLFCMYGTAGFCPGAPRAVPLRSVPRSVDRFGGVHLKVVEIFVTFYCNLII